MSRKNHTGHYEGALLEDINHKFDAILEGQQSLANVPRKLDDIDERLGRVESDVKAIKAVITNHEGRIIRLETASA